MAPQLSLAPANKMAFPNLSHLHSRKNSKHLVHPLVMHQARSRNEGEGRRTRQLTVKRPVNDWAQMVRNNPRIDGGDTRLCQLASYTKLTQWDTSCRAVRSQTWSQLWTLFVYAPQLMALSLLAWEVSHARGKQLAHLLFKQRSNLK